MSSSPLAQLGVRWLVFAIPESLLEKFAPTEGGSVKSESQIDFEVKLLMLVGENMADINSTQKTRYSNLRTRELKAKREMLNRVIPIKRERNHLVETEVNKLSDYLSESKFEENRKDSVQESSPDVAYNPYSCKEDMRADTRFTIVRKLRWFHRLSLMIGEEQSKTTFGSHIDVQHEHAILAEGLRSITLIVNDQYQIADNMSLIDHFSGPNIAPIALMKTNGSLVRRTLEETSETDFKPCQKTFEALFMQGTEPANRCINCEGGDDDNACTCNRGLRATKVWSTMLPAHLFPRQ